MNQAGHPLWTATLTSGTVVTVRAGLRADSPASVYFPTLSLTPAGTVPGNSSNHPAHGLPKSLLVPYDYCLPALIAQQLEILLVMHTVFCIQTSDLVHPSASVFPVYKHHRHLCGPGLFQLSVTLVYAEAYIIHSHPYIHPLSLVLEPTVNDTT